MSKDIIPTLRSDNTDYISSEIQAQVVKTEKLHKAPTLNIPLLEIEVDQSSLMAYIFGIVITYFIWKYLELFSLFERHKFIGIVFITQIVLFIAQIFTSSTKVASYDTESNILLSINQIKSVMLGSIILYAVFSKETNRFEQRLLYTTIIINCIFLVYVSVPRDENYIRQIRKIKQVGLNIVIFLFIIILYIRMLPSYASQK